MRMVMVVLVLIAGSVFAQQSEPDNRWYNIPLPLIETSSIPPQTPGNLVAPLGANGKLKYAIGRTVGPTALLNRAFLAGYSQYKNKPEEWGQGWDKYAQRYGYRMARLATRNAIIFGFDVALKTDQRYDRCACGGFFPRTGHALKRVFVARRDQGGEMFNFGRVTGAYVSAAVSYQLLPERYQTPRRVMTSGSQYLAWRVFGNTLREFWPEIHRVIRIGPKPTSQGTK